MLRPLAAVLKGTAAALAIIPCGRGNDLARVLGIPDDPAEAAELAVQGPERMLDVANVDGTPFVGIASFGFDSEANRIANEAKFVRGNAVYLYAALRALAAWKPAAFSVTVDGQRHELSGYSVAVGNSKAYGGGMFVLPEAELDDGELDVLISTDAPKLTFLRGVFKTFKAAHVDSPHALFLRGATIEVTSDRPFVIYGDGDPIGTTPATMRVERRCLRVIAPA
jgi:YegS/Rv2252/BmrU family lipid kinase